MTIDSPVRRGLAVLRRGSIGTKPKGISADMMVFLIPA